MAPNFPSMVDDDDDDDDRIGNELIIRWNVMPTLIDPIGTVLPLVPSCPMASFGHLHVVNVDLLLKI